MRTRHATRLLGLAGAVVCCAGVSRGRQATFTTSTQTVVVYATVHAPDGHLVTTLSSDAFRLFDDGQPVPITVFSHDIVPVTVAVMLDMSGSFAAQYSRIRDGATRFIDALLPADRARIGSFSDEVAVSPWLTGDKDILRRVVREELWPGTGTALWPAASIAMTSLAHEAGRRVVLLLTDGIDSGSDCRPTTANWFPTDPRAMNCSTPEAVRSEAVQNSVMFYAIGMEGATLGGPLVPLTDETGGGHFDVTRAADLGTTFERVADELHHQYLLGFVPRALDGTVHTLDVRMADGDLRARARKSYLASADAR